MQHFETIEWKVRDLETQLQRVRCCARRCGRGGSVRVSAGSSVAPRSLGFSALCAVCRLTRPPPVCMGLVTVVYSGGLHLCSTSTPDSQSRDPQPLLAALGFSCNIIKKCYPPTRTKCQLLNIHLPLTAAGKRDSPAATRGKQESAD